MKVRIINDRCLMAGWYKGMKGKVFEIYEDFNIPNEYGIYGGIGYKVKGHCYTNDDNYDIKDAYILVKDCEIITKDKEDKKMKQVTISVKEETETCILKNYSYLLTEYYMTMTYQGKERYQNQEVQIIEKDLKIPYPGSSRYMNCKVKINGIVLYARMMDINTEKREVTKDKVLFVPEGIKKICSYKNVLTCDYDVQCKDCFYWINNHELWVKSL